MSDWDFDKDGPLALEGEWEFHWKKFISPQKKTTLIPAQEPVYTMAPGLWNNLIIKNKKITGIGYATYRLRIKTSSSGKLLALRTHEMKTSYRLYINQKLLMTNGNPGTTPEDTIPQYLPKTANFIPNSNEITITLHIANFHNSKGGMLSTIWLGNENDILASHDEEIAIDLFLFGLLFMMGFYHLTLFILRPGEINLLLFSLYSMLVSYRTLITQEMFLYQTFPGMNWHTSIVIEYLNIYALLPIFCFFIRNLFPNEFKKIILVIVNLSSLIFSILAIFTSNVFFSQAHILYQVLIMLTILYIIGTLILSAIRKREGASILLIGCIFLGTTIFNDILYNNQVINTGYYTPLGLFIFIFSQSFILSKRFSRAFRTAELFSEKLIELDKLKDAFIANTSHELRTPLNGIIGISESLVEGAAGPIDPESANKLSSIISASYRLENMVKDLLDFSRLKNHDIYLRTKKIDLYPLVEVTLTIAEPLIQGKPIRLKNELDHNLPFVLGDEDRIQQIFHNLISNAIKFTQEGEVKVTARYNPKDGNFLNIVISDTGRGFDKKGKMNISTSFEQKINLPKPEIAENHLGLTITKELINLHGGSIHLKSSPGIGSDFHFTLPIFKEKEILYNKTKNKKTPSQLNNTPPELPKWDYTASNKELVLFADDDPTNLDLMTALLTDAGLEVITANNGLDALKFFNAPNKIPSIVILDDIMPGLSGFELTKKLRKNFSMHKLPIILLTSKGKKSDLLLALKLGANDFLYKPFDKNEILSRIRMYLTLKNAAESEEKLNLLKQELKIARKIQESILPKEIPHFSGIKIGKRYISANEVGGDFYDFNTTDSDKLGTLIADVSGHGIPAALIASMLKIAFTIQKKNKSEARKILSGLNNMLMGKIENHYITACYLLYDKNSMELSHFRAGHPYTIILRRNKNELIEFNGRSNAIGFWKDIKISHETIKSQSRDRVILYTDGIIECRNNKGKIYGDDRFKNLLMDIRDLSLDQFMDEIIRSIRKWNNNKDTFEDDISLLVMDID